MAGRVTVDGAPARLGQRIDPMAARVEVDGALVPVGPDFVYYLLNKPDGVITTADDPQGRPTVMTLVPAEPRVFPVGRLDRQTEGLLVLTNDGALAQLLTHPSHGVAKEYVAEVAGGTPGARRPAIPAPGGGARRRPHGAGRGRRAGAGRPAPRHPRGPQPPGAPHVRRRRPPGAAPRAHPDRPRARHRPAPGPLARPAPRRGPRAGRLGRAGPPRTGRPGTGRPAGGAPSSEGAEADR